MRIHTIQREQPIPLAPAEAFEFFSDPFNLEAITPRWLHLNVVTDGPIAMRPGTLIEYRLLLHALPLRWFTRIETWEPGRGFADVQLRGPYRLWHHTHRFEAHAAGTSMRAVVRYALPLGAFGRLARALLVRRDLERIFSFRRDTAAALLGEA